MDKVTAFFYEHAGYSYTPPEPPEVGRERCAKTLAAAERFASENGYSYQWEIDQFPTAPIGATRSRHGKVWSCVMRNADGEVCQSLGAINFGRDGEPWGNSYRRVVEAELALEEM